MDRPRHLRRNRRHLSRGGVSAMAMICPDCARAPDDCECEPEMITSVRAEPWPPELLAEMEQSTWFRRFREWLESGDHEWFLPEYPPMMEDEWWNDTLRR